MAIATLVLIALLGQPVEPPSELVPCPQRAKKIDCEFVAIVEFAQADADDCGTTWLVPPPDKPRPIDGNSLACVLEHVQKNAPFIFHDVSWGTDSVPGYALVQTAPGRLEVFSYDSNPGGALCGSGSSIRRAECQVEIRASTGAASDSLGFVPVPKGLSFPSCKLGPWRPVCTHGARESRQP